MVVCHHESAPELGGILSTMDFLRFLWRHPIAALLGFFGGVIVIGGFILDVYHVIVLGLPTGVWQAFGFSLFMGAIIAVLYRWDRAQRKKPEEGEKGELTNLGSSSTQTDPAVLALSARSIIVADLTMNLGRVSHPAPWLDFDGVGFNGTARRIRVVSAAGRVKFAGIDFPSELILRNPQHDMPGPFGIVVEPNRFFQFTIALSLTDRGAEAILSTQEQIPVYVLFLDAVLWILPDTGAPSAGPGDRMSVSIPFRTCFEVSGPVGEPKPRYLIQVIREQTG